MLVVASRMVGSPSSSARTDRITAAERKNHGLHGEGGREEPSRPRICLLQVDHLRTRSVGKVRRELEVDR